MEITISFEQSKKLRGLGYNSLCNFCYNFQGHLLYSGNGRIDTMDGSEYSLAPTAQEILDELPKTIQEATLEMVYDGEDVEVYYTGYESLGCSCCNETVNFGFHRCKNFTEAVANLRIRCKENGHLE